VLMHNTEVIEQETDLPTLTPRYTEQAIRFIRENRSSPMFLFLPQTYPHIPLGASERFRGKSSEGLYGDVVQEIDWSVGEIRRALKENGVEPNTLVIFTSDNGPWYQGSAGKLRGRKNTTYEGGVREPFIAAWQGKIPANRVCDALASMLDIFPTVTRLCGATLPAKPLDGIDIWPLLTNQKASIDREVLLYFDGWDLQCARWMNWKLHVARHNTAAYTPSPPEGRLNYSLARPELYNLASDPDESYDVAPQNPQTVAEMQRRINSLVPSFPEEVQKSWAEAQKRRSNPSVPAGASPRPTL
jgi:arylsulfatase A